MGGLVPTKVEILHPDGRREEAVHNLTPEPGYQALRQIVEPLLGGAFMERVAVLKLDGVPADMFVDEMGAPAYKNLPANPKATEIYRNNWLTQHPDDDPEDLPAIYGVAVLFDRRVWF